MGGSRGHGKIEIRLASFRPSRHISWQFSSPSAPERIPAMSNAVTAMCAVLMAILFGPSATASEPGHTPKLKISIIPRKAASARDRASEVVQKTPEFSLWDAKNKDHAQRRRPRLPCRANRRRPIVGHGYERRLTRLGLVQYRALTRPGRELFHPADPVAPQETFSYLMRGVVRYEADDLERAMGGPRCRLAA